MGGHKQFLDIKHSYLHTIFVGKIQTSDGQLSTALDSIVQNSYERSFSTRTLTF